MTTVAQALAVVVIGATSIGRWLRVSQHEHYLPGSAWATARRWLQRRPPNALLAVAWLATVTGSAFVGVIDDDIALLGLAAGLLGAVFPMGMPVAGRPRMRFTRRAVYEGLTAVVLLAAWSSVVGSTLSPSVAVGTAPVMGLLAVDAAAWLNRPVERRNARRFQRAASEKLERVRPRVVAVTGSFGKTTVKHHVRDLMGASVNVLASPASWNNLAGLSRAINEHMNPGTEVFVAEMGTYGPGEIRELVDWLKPEVAVITAVGPVHLERMGTLEVITAAKAEILDGARAAVICVDSPQLRELADKTREAAAAADLWRVGSEPGAHDLDVLVQRCTSGDADSLVVTARGDRLGEIPAGSLHAGNVACAVAACLAIGTDRRTISAGLSKLSAPANRAVAATSDDGLVVIDDTFNSNPAGASSALATLVAMVHQGRRVVVTPGMVELGALQSDANRRFAESVARAGVELVIVGWTNRRALLAGHPGATTVLDRDGASGWVRANLGPGDGVLWENDLPDHYP